MAEDQNVNPPSMWDSLSDRLGPVAHTPPVKIDNVAAVPTRDHADADEDIDQP